MVIGWFEKKKDAEAAVRQVREDFGDESEVYVLSGPAAAERMARTQKGGNPFKRFARFLWLWHWIDGIRFRELEDQGRRGGFMVVVQAKDDPTADEAARELANYGGREVTRFSRNEGVDVVGPRHAS
jgi:hypothetical protein